MEFGNMTYDNYEINVQKIEVLRQESIPRKT